MSLLSMFREALKVNLPRPMDGERSQPITRWLVPTGYPGAYPKDMTQTQAEFVLQKFVDEALMRRSSAAERELMMIAKGLNLPPELMEELRSDPTVLVKELQRQLKEMEAISRSIEAKHVSYAKKFRLLVFSLNNKKLQWNTKRRKFLQTSSGSAPMTDR